MFEGILSRRLTTLVGSLLLAAMATYALAAYIRGIETRTLQGAEWVKAFVAKDAIAAGTLGRSAIAEGMIALETLPRKLVSKEAVRSLQQIENRVAIVDILKGEQIVTSRFVDPSSAEGILPIPADRQAMAVELPMPPGVAGFIRANDRISVIAEFQEPEPRAQYLLQGIQVLAVGHQTASQQREGSDEGSKAEQNVLLTLAVTPDEAERLALALAEGEVHLTLLPPGQETSATSGRTLTSIFP